IHPPATLTACRLAARLRRVQAPGRASTRPPTMGTMAGGTIQIMTTVADPFQALPAQRIGDCAISAARHVEPATLLQPQRRAAFPVGAGRVSFGLIAVFMQARYLKNDIVGSCRGAAASALTRLRLKEYIAVTRGDCAPVINKTGPA